MTDARGTDRAIVEREMPCSRACDAPLHSDFCRQRREAGLRIAAAVREEGWREGMEEAAKAQCDGCSDGLRHDADDMPTDLRAALDATSRGWFRTTEDAPSERSRMLAINSALAVTLAVECPWLRPGHADAERLLMRMAAAAVEAYHWPERPAP